MRYWKGDNKLIYLIMKKLVIGCLLFLPLVCTAQSADIRHYKSANATDTTFIVSSGLVKVTDSLIMVNGTQYQATYTGQYNVPMVGYTYQTYNLSNGWSAVVTLFCNNELEAVTLDEGTQVETYYTR